MNYGNSNAEVLVERRDRERVIVRTNYSVRRRNMAKQKLCGVVLIAAALFATWLAEDMELLLGMIPLGIFLIATHKQYLTFEEE